MNFDEMEKKADLIDRNRLRAAERILLKMLAADPKSVGAHFNLGRVYMRMDQFPRAVVHGQRTLRLSPKEHNAHLNLGIVYGLMGNSELALANYKRELRLDPCNSLTHWWMGRLYFAKRQWRKAGKHLKRSIDLGYTHQDADTVYKIGHCCFTQNDVHTYLSVYEWYLTREPSSAWASSNYAGTLMHAKQYRRAVLWSMKAVRLDPSPKNQERLRGAQKALQKQRGIKPPRPALRVCEAAQGRGE